MCVCAFRAMVAQGNCVSHEVIEREREKERDRERGRQRERERELKVHCLTVEVT